MKEAVLVDGIRTPIGRAHAEKGALKDVRPDELLAQLYKAMFARNPKVKPEDVEAVLIGCANQSGPQNAIARLAWLAAGMPENVAANGIEMQCASAMAAIQHCCHAIMAGEGDIYIGGGVEDMLRVGMGANMDFPPALGKRYNVMEIPMGQTAEKVARMYNITRAEMDKFGYESHMKAAKAWAEGKFKDEVIPIEAKQADGSVKIIDKDQGPRGDTTIEQMGTLKPAFLPPDKSMGVTAGNSSPLNQGASLCLLMSRDKADKLGLSYTLRYKAGAIAGLDPTVMGLGPIYATRKCFERSGLTAKDIDICEINEAFASQSIASLRDLGIPQEKANIWGGGIAIGHPLGNSGSRITITLNSIMKTDRKDAKYGLATLCVGFGQGAATIWERVK